jgi:epoxyqueuosine reductase
MKPMLHELANFIRSRTDGTQRFKVCVDSVPLAERALAARAGLGFVGTNHMLIHPTLGPQVLLGELVATVELEPDAPTVGTCVACDRCIRACPTGALQANGRFDARKCISYLTIEHRGEIASELAAKIGNRIFGCDECVLVCPYRHAAPGCGNREFTYHAERAALNLERIMALSAETFATEFANSPIGRPGLDGLQRNARICLENAGVD